MVEVLPEIRVNKEEIPIGEYQWFEGTAKATSQSLARLSEILSLLILVCNSDESFEVLIEAQGWLSVRYSGTLITFLGDNFV